MKEYAELLAAIASLLWLLIAFAVVALIVLIKPRIVRIENRGQVLQCDKWPDTSPPWRDPFVWSLPGQFII